MRKSDLPINVKMCDLETQLDGLESKVINFDEFKHGSLQENTY
jgi:hypothetical protein